MTNQINWNELLGTRLFADYNVFIIIIILTIKINNFE